jgi:hypothetical protein
MPKITSQTGLTLATTSALADGNVFIDTTGFLIHVGQHVALDEGGVSLQALYSFLMKQWATMDYEKFKFPIESITPGEFELKNGWDFADDTTRYLIRDGGWNLLSADNLTVYEVWMNIQTLGNFNAATDQAYYMHSAVGTPVNFQLDGVVNQAVQIYGDGVSGRANIDYRTTAASEFSVFLREQGKTYASYNLNIEQAKTSLKNNVYALPLSNAIDLDIEASDASIILNTTSADFSVASNVITDVGGTPFAGLIVGDTIVLGSTAGGTNDGIYTIKVATSSTVVEVNETMTNETSTAGVTITGKTAYLAMKITWGANTNDFGSGAENFGILIDANSGTLQEIYEFVQYKLRQPTDIDDGVGTETGQVSDAMLGFVGPTLKTKLTADGGVYIENFLTADTNDLVFVDDTGVEKTYPYVAAGVINFNDNLQADGASAKYWMYFASAGTFIYNTSTAAIVNDNDSMPIAGDLTGNLASVSFSFDYEGNVQGGRTPNVNAPIILIAIGTNNAQYVSASDSLTRSTLMSFTLTAAKERNYVA